MGDLTIPDEAIEAAVDAVVEVRDAAPRLPRDADSSDVAMAALHAAAPLVVAAELDRLLTAEIATDRGREHFPAGLPSYACGREDEAVAWIRVIRARAAELRSTTGGDTH